MGPDVLSFAEVLPRWVAREGDRYVPLLIERRFLLPEERSDAQKVQQAMYAWRRTYVEDLSPETRVWEHEHIRDVREILNWRLGGWHGWLAYRREGKNTTTFRDVIAGLDDPTKAVPEQHRILIPEIARGIMQALQTKDLFLFRCGHEIAALDGTHTLAGIAYAIVHGLKVPEALEVYMCEFPEKERELFERFCIDRPVRYGTS